MLMHDSFSRKLIRIWIKFDTANIYLKLLGKCTFFMITFTLLLLTYFYFIYFTFLLLCVVLIVCNVSFIVCVALDVCFA
jgi:hypothetical protein